jgi:hypothetical protein
MLVFSRVCMCLGLVMLSVGYNSRVGAAPAYPKCNTLHGCEENNSPSSYCNFAAGDSYWVCGATRVRSECTPGGSWWGTTCYGIDLAGQTCSTYFANCV